MKKAIFLLLFLFLIYTRFFGLNWGLPYPMHPDERNMAEAVTQITLLKPYSPSFWAYGGFQINLAHFLLFLKKFITLKNATNYGFIESILMLRFISAIFSLLAVYFGIKIIYLLNGNFYTTALSLSLFIFSPALIQMGHFGTTESSLTFFYLSIIYFAILIIKKQDKVNIFREIFGSGFFLGMAIATKATAGLFILVPLIAITWRNLKVTKKKWILFIANNLKQGISLIVLMLTIAIIFSPHYLLYHQDFIRSLLYERSLVTGQVAVFYTRQFFQTIPVIFQLKHIFPYMLGAPMFIISIFGFIFSSWKKPEYNLIRFASLLYFVPTAFLYTKWARYMTPVIPIMIIFSILLLSQYSQFLKIKFKTTNFMLLILTIILIVPGLAYLSIYKNPDVRFKASEWIYQNVPSGSYILSETANVIDVPINVPNGRLNNPKKSYTVSQFNFYDIDENSEIERQLKDHLAKADYIFIPSRRVFMNHGCFKNDQLSMINYQKRRCDELRKMYPILNDYYENLFSGKLGFKKIAEITSYPRIELLGKTLLEFPDEQAEETWTVFDHPVIRIYKRI